MEGDYQIHTVHLANLFWKEVGKRQVDKITVASALVF